MKKQSGGIFRLFLFPFWLCSQTSFFSPITCENNIFVFIHKAFIKDIPPHRASERARERTMSGVTTRAQKRRIGERDSLWDVIVKCDDICFTHILPRLNANDLKFLYGVNTETRKLIKRSSRKGELKKGFKVKEMSSISTLEFAWEHKSLWPSWLTNEMYFCVKVAQTNKLELLKWVREEKKCEWDKGTLLAATQRNTLPFPDCLVLRPF